MSRPTVANYEALKRLGRYLIKFPRYRVLYEYQAFTRNLNVWSDSDFAGCCVTRKSTSGAVVRFGKHILKTYASTQSIISLSSGEAEYYGMVKAATVALGTQSIFADFRVSTDIELKSDASAAIGIAMRKGLGKVRHIEVNQLWLQEKVSEGLIKVTKVNGNVNLADHLTKHVEANKMQEYCKLLRAFRDSTRHDLTPHI